MKKSILFVFAVFFAAGTMAQTSDSGMRVWEGNVVTYQAPVDNIDSITFASKSVIGEALIGDLITGITPIYEDEVEVGYTMSFLRHAPINIYHGKKGDKGDKGEKGDSMFQSVTQDEDSVYFAMTDGTTISIFKGNGHTCGGNVQIVDGAIQAPFSVSATKTVHFSKGNLQYQASSGTWRFAEHQYDTIGETNKNIASDYDGWIDLFGWGTGSNPTLASGDYNDYSTFTDWGANPISNGGNNSNEWRTLSRDEWFYLFRERANATTLFGFGTINGINGVIILPDNWTTPSCVTFIASTSLGLMWENQFTHYSNSIHNNYSHNKYNVEQWGKMESVGAVFLPAAGFRLSSEVRDAGSVGEYWSSTSKSPAEGAYDLDFTSKYLSPQGGGRWPRYAGYSVRLVQEAK